MYTTANPKRQIINFLQKSNTINKYNNYLIHMYTTENSKRQIITFFFTKITFHPHASVL